MYVYVSVYVNTYVYVLSLYASACIHLESGIYNLHTSGPVFRSLRGIYEDVS